MEFLRCGAEVRMDRKEIQSIDGGRAAWRVDEEVVEAGIAIRGLRDQKATAGKRGEYRFHHASGHHGSEDGIERGAAVFENFDRCCRGFRMPAGDCAFRHLHTFSTSRSATSAPGSLEKVIARAGERGNVAQEWQKTPLWVMAVSC